MKIIAAIIGFVTWTIVVYKLGVALGKHSAMVQTESAIAKLREVNLQLRLAVASNQQKDKHESK